MFILFSHIMCSLKCHQDTKSDGFLIETRWGFFAFIRKQDKLSVKLMVMNPNTVDALCSLLSFPSSQHLKKRNSHQNYCCGTSFFINAWRICSRKWCWGGRARGRMCRTISSVKNELGCLSEAPQKSFLICFAMKWVRLFKR